MLLCIEAFVLFICFQSRGIFDRGFNCNNSYSVLKHNYKWNAFNSNSFSFQLFGSVEIIARFLGARKKKEAILKFMSFGAAHFQ